jgi:transposase
MERDEKAREEYQEKVDKLDKKDIIYLDESGIDDTETYEFGWVKKGERLLGMKKGSKTERLSFISALSQKTLCASLLFAGSCDRKVFETYIEKVLVPTLMPGKTIVLDNASFHHGEKIKKLINDAGCELLYLPPYSPDLNPIEHFWAPLKNKIRQFLPKHSNNLYEAALEAFEFVGV